MIEGREGRGERQVSDKSVYIIVSVDRSAHLIAFRSSESKSIICADPERMHRKW